MITRKSRQQADAIQKLEKERKALQIRVKELESNADEENTQKACIRLLDYLEMQSDPLMLDDGENHGEGVAENPFRRDRGACPCTLM
jgi:hypothetical protein